MEISLSVTVAVLEAMGWLSRTHTDDPHMQPEPRARPRTRSPSSATHIGDARGGLTFRTGLRGPAVQRSSEP